MNRAHGTSYVLIHQLPGGYRSGAYLVRDRNGREAVLKFSPDPSWARHVIRAAPVIAEARRSGWPTPAWLTVGTTRRGHLYHLQERAAGTSPEHLTASMARQALPILDWQCGRGPNTDQDWSAYDRAVVFTGESDLLTAIEEHSPTGRALTRAVRSSLHQYQACTLPTSDLVHGDFTPDNILLDHDSLTAIIDVEAAGRGSRFHDLATLSAHGTLWDGEPGTDALLRAYARRYACPGEFEISLAAAFITILASHITAHDHPDDADELFTRATTSILRTQ
ncbi:phosphotransferase [Kribbella sp. NPDC051620]|uniref:phosphotransferase n=1 Tax=Kribbella sp. NPDC051620 TaxID=3364120 RepID=UPI0037A8D51F